MPVLDVNILKTMIGIDIDDVSQDSILNLVLGSAESLVEKELGIFLTPTTINEYIFGDNSRFLYVSYRPISFINSVKEYPITFGYSNHSYNTYRDITDYIEISNSLMGELFNKVKMFAGNCRYEINYQAGFDVIPEDLKYAIYQIAVKLYAMTEYQKTGASRITTPDGTIVYDSSIIPNGIKDILDKYRRIL
jgi:hypothetical protein